MSPQRGRWMPFFSERAGAVFQKLVFLLALCTARTWVQKASISGAAESPVGSRSPGHDLAQAHEAAMPHFRPNPVRPCKLGFKRWPTPANCVRRSGCVNTAATVLPRQESSSGAQLHFQYVIAALAPDSDKSIVQKTTGNLVRVFVDVMSCSRAMARICRPWLGTGTKLRPRGGTLGEACRIWWGNPARRGRSRGITVWDSLEDRHGCRL